MIPPLALTMGEPAGISGEITLKAWRDHRDNLPAFFLIDCPHRISHIANQLGWTIPICPIEDPAQAKDVFVDALPILEHPVTAGEPGILSKHSAKPVINSIERAVELTQKGAAAGIVTNPIHKHNLHNAGFNFPGHTEFLADLAGISTPPIMMLACDELRVVPITVHVSLSEAIKELTTELIIEKCKITAHGLEMRAGIKHPRLALAGLNPHAGEDGDMGREEIDIIAPAVKQLKAEGFNVTGPLPPDTMFHKEAREQYDVAMCMYHDQGLIPVKTLAFDLGVNVTLGLPFIRTSPDHGTALNIAGTGKASENSLCAAIKMAGDMAQRQKEQNQ
ncbi:4-hydroxythreonine-4-phosphate dehydrogenase [Candidatus Terasakiella magnetica]|uniref:4-hydroxythreonine-4-phosphate dehydrogenase n=1 Tax=Candidatus Terasakiella magnetica TaxID=1867952 RepID=A0A1C3RK79_9PROT|nr:4-hydroxythreonine-4-phosphate dehydrogenase PdxA [Candidatus Terasakiella magnetica]SCA57653.1 4-hydroxythreonine-4-phosphate dehydrogenase [Candidatus Terasakiella magnetica]